MDRQFITRVISPLYGKAKYLAARRGMQFVCAYISRESLAKCVRNCNVMLRTFYVQHLGNALPAAAASFEVYGAGFVV